MTYRMSHVIMFSMFLSVISLISTPVNALPMSQSCLKDQFFGTCLDIWGAGEVNYVNTTNIINNSYYNISGGVCTDKVNKSGDTMTAPLRIEGDTQDSSELYLGVSYADNKSIYFKSGSSSYYYIRFNNDLDAITTNAMWNFEDTAQFRGALAGEPVIGVDDVFSYGDVGLYGSGGAVYLGGYSKSGASMIIEQSGSVDFKTPNFTIQNTGEVCINCNDPAEMLDVNGNVTADDFITKSVAYNGDAVTELSKIRSESSLEEWAKVDHSSLGSIGVSRTYKVPVYDYVNVTRCELVRFDDRYDNICSLREEKRLTGYMEETYEGVSLDRAVAMLIKANQELAERIKVLEERLGVKA